MKTKHIIICVVVVAALGALVAWKMGWFSRNQSSPNVAPAYMPTSAAQAAPAAGLKAGLLSAATNAANNVGSALGSWAKKSWG